MAPVESSEDYGVGVYTRLRDRPRDISLVLAKFLRELEERSALEARREVEAGERKAA
jgi:hypothetical protein